MRVAGGTLTIDAPSRPDGWNNAWPAGTVSALRLEELRTLGPVRRARLTVVAVDGRVCDVVVPWGGADALPAVESRLREALGLARRNLSPARRMASRAS